MSRKRLRHPEAAMIAKAHVGGPRPPFKPRFTISLFNYTTRDWAARGYDVTHEGARERLRSLLANQDRFTGGWIKQSWERV